DCRLAGLGLANGLRCAFADCRLAGFGLANGLRCAFADDLWLTRADGLGVAFADRLRVVFVGGLLGGCLVVADDRVVEPNVVVQRGRLLTVLLGLRGRLVLLA